MSLDIFRDGFVCIRFPCAPRLKANGGGDDPDPPDDDDPILVHWQRGYVVHSPVQAGPDAFLVHKQKGYVVDVPFEVGV